MDWVDQSFTSFDNLDYELVTEILLRLPAKTVVQSTSVCKLWYSIFKDPSFISTHLSRGFDRSNSYIFIDQPKSSSIIVISDHNNVLTRQYPNYILPFETRSQTYSLVGTCNGLVCLTDHDQKYHGTDIYLLNPFINKYKKIGPESSCYSYLIEQIGRDDNSRTIRVFFEYCEYEKDFKIFRILFHYDNGNYTIVPKRFEMYSLNTNAWKVIEGTDGLDVNSNRPVYVNGCLYWEPSWQDYEPIQCFDMKEKLFYKINLPNKITEKMILNDVIGVFGKEGSLAIWHINGNTLPVRIYLYLLDKGINDGCKELLRHETESYIYENCLGFSGIGRLIFCGSSVRETSIVAIDFDNSCAVETLPLLHNVTVETSAVFNVFESLVLF